MNATSPYLNQNVISLAQHIARGLVQSMPGTAERAKWNRRYLILNPDVKAACDFAASKLAMGIEQ